VSTTRAIRIVSDHREGIVSDFTLGHHVVRPHEIELVDVELRYEFVDVDGPGALERDVDMFLLVDGDVGVGVDLVALDDVLLGHFFPRFGVDLGVLDAGAGVLVDLVEGDLWVEADLFGFRGRRKQGDRTGHQRQPQKALPVSPRRHRQNSIIPEGDSIGEPGPGSLAWTK
jgi:hypothetical protein